MGRHRPTRASAIQAPTIIGPAVFTNLANKFLKGTMRLMASPWEAITSSAKYTSGRTAASHTPRQATKPGPPMTSLNVGCGFFAHQDQRRRGASS